VRTLVCLLFYNAVAILTKMKRRMILFVALAVIAILSLQLLVTNKVSSDQGYLVETPFDSITGPPHWLFNGSCSKYLEIAKRCIIGDGHENITCNAELCEYKIHDFVFNTISYSVLRNFTNATSGKNICNATINLSFSNFSNACTRFTVNLTDLNYLNEGQLPPYDKSSSTNKNGYVCSLSTGEMLLVGTNSPSNKEAIKVDTITLHHRSSNIISFLNESYSSYSGLLVHSCSHFLVVSNGNISQRGIIAVDLLSTNTDLGPNINLGLLYVNYQNLTAMPFLVIAAVMSATYYVRKK
jgi:hypothetical protein